MKSSAVARVAASRPRTTPSALIEPKVARGPPIQGRNHADLIDESHVERRAVQLRKVVAGQGVRGSSGKRQVIHDERRIEHHGQTALEEEVAGPPSLRPGGRVAGKLVIEFECLRHRLGGDRRLAPVEQRGVVRQRDLGEHLGGVDVILGADQDAVAPGGRIVQCLGRGKQTVSVVGRGQAGIREPVPAVP
jgi:hypothetical protein